MHSPEIVYSESLINCKLYWLFVNRSYTKCNVIVVFRDKNNRTFGIIAEIYEHSVDIETAQSFQIKAMCHQRYEIISLEEFPERYIQKKLIITHDVTNTYFSFEHLRRIIQLSCLLFSHERMPIGLAQIKIIPDVTLNHPLTKLCLHPKKRYLNHSEM